MNSKLYIPIAGICSILVVSNLYLLIPVINELKILFQYNTEEISIISSAYSLFYAPGFLVWGLVNIKIGSKKTILYGLLGLSVITVLFSLTMNRDNFTVFRACQGLLASSFAPSIINLFSSSVSRDKKGFALGFISCTFHLLYMYQLYL